MNETGKYGSLWISFSGILQNPLKLPTDGGNALSLNHIFSTNFDVSNYAGKIVTWLKILCKFLMINQQFDLFLS